MNGPRIAILCGVVLSVSCQRAPADVSAIKYQVVDEGRARGECIVCVLPNPAAECAGEGEAAKVRWHLPATLDGKDVRIQVRRADGSQIDIASDSPEGQAVLPVELQLDDRISVVDSADEREVLFTRVEKVMGCSLRSAE